MSADYRILHFVPNTSSGMRIPVAAVVRRDGANSFQKAHHIPDAYCLGGEAYGQLLFAALRTLESADFFDALPAAAGPHFALGEVSAVPAGVEDVGHWLERFILPISSDAPAKHRRGLQRASSGFRWLEKLKLDAFVHKRFTPAEENVMSMLGASEPVVLPSLSHWTGNRETGLLLMEPLGPSRLGAEKELTEVVTRFAAYRHFLSETWSSAPSTELIAYILPSSSPSIVDEFRGRLKGTAHTVVDTSLEVERLDFVARVRDVGQRSAHQPMLH